LNIADSGPGCKPVPIQPVQLAQSRGFARHAFKLAWIKQQARVGTLQLNRQLIDIGIATAK
jgi:hypothetical protein